MSRGRHPDLGRGIAEPVARRRGTVHMIEPGPDTLFDLIITSPGTFAAVIIRRAQRLCAPLPDLVAESGDLVCLVRQLPCGGQVSREIWWYNRNGRWRFFRIDETDIVELSADGTPHTPDPKNAVKPDGEGAGIVTPSISPPGKVPVGEHEGDHPALS
ncbi:hypothetical protein [Methanoregula sp.]|uniref:hypothetical protein n=1 Tax=Methanoregula sp. TaxID=2052170 RepID=UPI0035695527